VLALLTDEQISYVVAEQVNAKRPEIAVESLRAWQGGAFEGVADEALLEAAALAGRTLVTYDPEDHPAPARSVGCGPATPRRGDFHGQRHHRPERHRRIGARPDRRVGPNEELELGGPYRVPAACVVRGITDRSFRSAKGTN